MCVFGPIIQCFDDQLGLSTISAGNKRLLECVRRKVILYAEYCVEIHNGLLASMIQNFVNKCSVKITVVDIMRFRFNDERKMSFDSLTTYVPEGKIRACISLTYIITCVDHVTK